MKFTAILAAGMAALAMAAPAADDKGKGKGVKHVASYDDIKSNPLTVVLARPPRPYLGLNYTGISVQNLTTVVGQPVPKINARSPPNTAYFNTVTQLTQGFFPSIRAASGGLFNLQSMYAGCTVNTGIAAAPINCTIRAATLGADGVRHLKEFKLPGSANLTLIQFPKVFRKSKLVTFVLTLGLPNSVLSAHIDDLTYKLL